jgi:adenylate cyclase
MSDVFISYARSTELQAEEIAAGLRDAGYDVWRDDQIPAYRAYAQVIEERLRGAKAVVVIWSEDAVQSQWVRAEADAARELGTLIQVTVDGTMPPLPFNQIQCARLDSMTGPGWTKVEESVAALVGRTASEPMARKATGSSPTVCVLPFTNMSGDAEQEYFSDGISEDITTDLSKISALHVVARNTAFSFKGRSPDVRDVARVTGATHVIEGSVRKSGSRVRISAQLIDGITGAHVWAERYDRDLTDIFAIQDELSAAIVEALRVKLLPEEKKLIENRGTENIEAYNLYLMARQQWISGVQGETRREESVIRLCDRAIGIDPKYGRAWALKALAQSTLHFGYTIGEEDGVATANHALKLDPNLAEAHSAKARAALYRRDFAEAEAEIGCALELAPESWEVNKEAVGVFVWQKKFGEAARYCEKCIALVPDDLQSWDTLMMIQSALHDEGKLREAAQGLFERSEAVIAREPQNHYAYGRAANALVVLGDIQRAQDWIGRALLIAPDNLDIRYNFACTLCAYPEWHEIALDHIAYVFSRSVGSIVRRADIDVDLDPVRSNPRFIEIYDRAMKRIAQIDQTEQVSPPADEGRPRS